MIPRLSSALKAVDMAQSPPPLIIGERLNTQGSRKAKQLVLDCDFDGLVELARGQVEDGAHCLDVCVALTERPDELAFMQKLVKRLSLEVNAPLVIDSTDPAVISAAVRQIPGRPMINSINLEGDGSRFHSLAPIMAEYGVPAVAMCIGPKGMAKSAEEKLQVARLLYDTGAKYGLKPWQYVFDVLTFTLATGEQEYADSAKSTLEGIRLVKQELPGSFTVLGLSNVSFGLSAAARKVVNSVFLYHALRAGLDMVIINARDIMPFPEIPAEQRRLAEDLIFNRHPNALAELIAFFQEAGASGAQGAQSRRTEVDPSWDAGRRCYFRIVNRLKEGIQEDVVQAISDRTDGASESRAEAAHRAAVQTLNEVLLPAMKEVGDKFGAGELILPFVLKSAECMKAAVAELEKYLIKQEGVSKGKLVLCTVYGDVHDIGKNLVKTIFVNNGYTVYDLGKQVPMQRIIEKIAEVGADAVGLSALLVSTSKQMQYFVEYARENNLQVPVLCGGAAINSSFVNRIAKGGGTVYQPGVFYCKTAFDGLRTMNELVSQSRGGFLQDWRARIEKWEDRPQAEPSSNLALPNSGIEPVSPPEPPQIARAIRLEPSEIDLEQVWKYVNKKSLAVLQWGIRGSSAKEHDPEALFAEWKDRVLRERLFEPRAVYGYFRCHNLSPGEPGSGRLAVDLHATGTEKVVFEFPRSSKEKHLCLADYFGKDDVAAFQAVTVGNRATAVIDMWNKEDRYSDAYHLHGLAVETAEAMAEWVNAKIRQELGIGAGRGLRYSWGYPSCPDISQHHLVWKLLRPDLSGMTLTEAGQIVPDQSTAAIVVHHPKAEYFVL